MNIEDIIQKHGYDLELSTFLRKVYPELVNEFENEQTVYDALMSCKIILTNNLYNCLKGYGFLENEKDQGIVSFETLKICSGVYHSEPKVIYNKGLNAYSLEDVNRIVAINANSLALDIHKATLIHEIGHLIKSYYNEYTIKGDKIVEKSGLITRTYQLKEENGIVSKELWNETGVGLEEGFNAIFEENVTSKVIRRPYRTNAYQALKEIAKLMINIVPGIYEVIKDVELYHSNTRIDNLLGQTYYDLRGFADTIYPLIVKISDINVKKDERNKIQMEVYGLIYNELKPITNSLKTIGQNSKGL